MTKSMWDLNAGDYVIIDMETEKEVDYAMYCDEERGVCFQMMVDKETKDGADIICDPKTRLPFCRIVLGKFRMVPAPKKKETDKNDE
jgi:hypothetical protein